jgi:hypothetical protein
MPKRTRRHHTAEQKAIVLKRYLVDKVPVSDLAQLEAKLARKDAVIAEISEEYVHLKKELGEP